MDLTYCSIRTMLEAIAWREPWTVSFPFILHLIKSPTTVEIALHCYVVEQCHSVSIRISGIFNQMID